MGLIYKVTNKINGKIYIGKTTLSLDDRKKRHQGVRLKPKLVFQKALLKYKFDSFEWIIIEEISNLNLSQAEIKWIAELNSNDPKIGYNRTKGGDGVVSGIKDSKTTRKRKSEGMLGKRNAANSENKKRKPHTMEHRLANQKLVWVKNTDL